MRALRCTSGCNKHFWEVESLGTALPLRTEFWYCSQVAMDTTLLS